MSKSSRRRFLKNSALALGGLTMACAGGPRAAFALDGLKRRRHFISIVAFGAWDPRWSLNGMRTSSLATANIREIGAIVKPDGSGYHTDITAAGSLFTSRFKSTYLNEAVNGVGYTLYYPDAFAKDHPLHSGHLVGPALQAYDSTDFGDMAILRGLMSEGGHEVGNRILLAGSTTSYVPSIGPFLARTLSQDYVRSLHYVQSGVRSSMIQLGTLRGVAEPIQIEDFLGWKGTVAAPNGNEDLIKDGVNNLARATRDSRMKLKRSRDVFDFFMGAYNGAINLLTDNASTNPAVSPDLKLQAAFNRYYTLMKTAFDTFNVNGTAFNSTRGLGDANVRFAASTPSIASLGNGANPNAIQRAAFQFALAETLVVEDLSAVVEIQPLASFDYHTHMQDQFVGQLILFTGFKELMRVLRTTQVGITGKSLLDSTTLLISTEHDRDPRLSFVEPEPDQIDNPGTGHHIGTTCVLAGMGVKGGQVIGDYNRGTGKHAEGSFSSTSLTNPLPMNLSTGRPSESGTVHNVRSIFPTIASIYGSSASLDITPEPIILAALK